MSWKNLFFEMTEDNKEEKINTKKETVINKPTSENTSFNRRLPNLKENKFPISTQTLVPAQEVNLSEEQKNKYNEHFNEVLNNTNLPVPNYYTFSRMLGEMGDLPDQAKYKGAFAALKVQGLNKSHLLDSANTYLKILDQDRVNFRNEVNQNVEETNKEIESLKLSVRKNEDEIARIKADTQAQIDNLTRMMNNQVEKLQSVNSRNQAEIEPLEERAQKVVSKIAVYDAAASQYRAVIEGDIQKIESLIQ